MKRKKTEGREVEEGGENNEKKGRTLPSMIREGAPTAPSSSAIKNEKRNQAKSRDVAIKRALDLGEEAMPPFPF